jgi:uncharacterized protein RhaS with RHS repeats
MKKLSLILAIALSTVSVAALAAEAIVYSYDSNGRLVRSARTGSVNNGVTTIYAYDAADNRTNVTVTISPNGAVTPPPPPPPVAQIVALNPTFPLSNGASRVVTIAELANLNGQAATIASFTPAAGNGSAVIAPDGASVTYTALRLGALPRCEPGYRWVVVVPYSIRNTASGAVVSGNVTFNIAIPPGPSGRCQ